VKWVQSRTGVGVAGYGEMYLSNDVWSDNAMLAMMLIVHKGSMVSCLTCERLATVEKLANAMLSTGLYSYDTFENRPSPVPSGSHPPYANPPSITLVMFH
jgi:hypothetical protein